MKRHVSWLITLAVLVGAVGLLYHSRLGEHGTVPPPTPAKVPVPPPPPPSVQSPVAQAPAPLVRYPLGKPLPGANGARGSGHGTAQSHPLPSLEKSDATVGTALAGLIGRQAFDSLFRLKSIVRHIVVTVDDLPRTKLPPRDRPTRPVAGHFVVTGEAGDYVISPDNYRRYTPYVVAFERVDVKELVSVYLHFYPLLEQAYKDLGYPSGYFNDRLVDTIDNLLATPNVQGPVRLVRPTVMYKFADPKLEALSVGQKILIRMGLRNEARVKAKLRVIRKALLAQVAGSARNRR